MPQTIGIIGGSGLYELPGLEDARTERVDTPFGAPSSELLRGRMGDAELIFIPRHGRNHELTPTEVPYRANLYALKRLGADWCIGVSAVGSLREEIVPGHVVLVDQYIDRTKGIRDSTFFGDGVAAHVPFGDPVCPWLHEVLVASAREAGATVHERGTYVVMEGPAFSTRAESNLYRSWGASVIGMTNLPEAKLAREAGISYASVAMATDYDCWHPGHDNVDVEQVVAVLTANVALSRQILANAIPRVAAYEGRCPQHAALANAVMTRPEAMDDATRERLWPIIGEFVS